VFGPPAEPVKDTGVPKPQILAVLGVIDGVIPAHGFITLTFTLLNTKQPVDGSPPPLFGVIKFIAYSSTSP
jgi:hypothetical protein